MLELVPTGNSDETGSLAASLSALEGIHEAFVKLSGERTGSGSKVLLNGNKRPCVNHALFWLIVWA